MLTIKKLILSTIVLLFVWVHTLAQDGGKVSDQSPVGNAKKSHPSFEANVFLPFLGISDLKVLIPTRSNGMLKGAWVLGIYGDYGWGELTRPDDKYGKVRFIAVKVGWRQFFWKGLHLDATVNMGQRHEVHNIYDNTTLDSFASRAWIFGGWQGDIFPRIYYNVRGGLGIFIIRTDRYADTERKLVPAIDINLGFRF